MLLAGEKAIEIILFCITLYPLSLVSRLALVSKDRHLTKNTTNFLITTAFGLMHSQVSKTKAFNIVVS